ncbi:MAG: LysM peptidoglycan-binding domain-containing protein [Clostridia bacterium]|nr:LysM peptidoglycan-binding domain-containing protein [Clostridia bacterium]
MPCPKTKECPTGSLPYIVREGDTLNKIALAYTTSVDAILKANVNLNPYNLNIGQTICIPLPNEEYPSCRTTNYYIAQEGDTFFSIGRKFGVDTEEIINANMGVRPENIYTGIILCIPVAPSPVCLSLSRDGTTITLINKITGTEKSYKSTLSANSNLVPGRLILTKKRLESGDVEGAKEVLFSPFEFGIRGETIMRDSTGLFVETDNKSMLEIFNACPVGTILEVENR